MATPNIITTLGNLTLHTKKCFGDLPAKLRLQIWNHALPPPGELKVLAEILTSDSHLRLRLTFHLISTRAAITKMHLMAHDRALSLLSINLECRQLYLSKFHIVLPCGPNGLGKLRMRSEDTLFVWNMGYLLWKLEFRRALSNRYRLQDGWSQVQHVAIPIFSVKFVDGFAAMVGCLRDLRVLELVGRDEWVFNKFLLRRAIGTGKFERTSDSFFLRVGPQNNRMEIFIREG
jgi:hypothetical protein